MGLSVARVLIGLNKKKPKKKQKNKTKQNSEPDIRVNAERSEKQRSKPQ